MSPVLLPFRRRAARPAAPSTLRIDVCPPEADARRETPWMALLRWLVGNDADVAPVLRSPLERARTEFIGALGGLVHVEAGDLARRAGHARSLRELWHLRTELYTVVARYISQAEAESRMVRVNQHFPTRAQRSAILTPEILDAR